MNARGAVPLLATLALVAPAAAAELPHTAGWIAMHSDHFDVYSEVNARRTRTILVDLERFRTVLSQVTAGFEFEPRVRTSVFVFKNEDSLRPYKLDDAGKPRNVAGYYLTTPLRDYIALDASADSGGSRVVYHEYVHALLRTTFSGLPQWLNEGLAEFYSTFRFRESSNTAWLGEPIEGHLYFLAENGMMDLERLFSITTRSPEYSEGTLQGTFYAQSWLLVHYLVGTDDRRPAFGRYLATLRSGDDPSAALAAALGADDDALLERLEAYRRSGSGAFRLTLPDDVATVSPEDVELEPAEVLLRLGELQAVQEETASATAHLDAALEAGAAPARVHAVRGIAAERANDRAAAARWFREAIDADPDDALALTRLGRLQLHGNWNTLDFGLETPPPPIAEARELFARALRLDSRNVEAMAGFGETFLFERSDEELGARALAGAATLAPDRLDIPIHLAMLLAKRGRPDSAWAVIETRLRPSDLDPDRLRPVEAWALAAEIEAIEGALRAGDPGRARSLFEQAAARVTDPELRVRLDRLETAIGNADAATRARLPGASRSGRSPRAAAMSDALDLANDGDMDGALRLLAAAREECADTDDTTCEAIRRFHDEIEARAARQRDRDRFNAAVDALNDGRRDEALAILRALASDARDDEVRSRSAELAERFARP